MRRHRQSAGALVLAAAVWGGGIPAAAPAVAASTPVTYYVDSSTGSDSNSGTSPSSPWKSLAKVSGAALNPGDTVAFNRGETFTGQLAVKRSGAAGAPITYTSYGTGSLPVITGSGVSGGDYCSTVLIKDYDHLAFDSIQIENPRTVSRPGIDDTCAYGVQVVNDKASTLSDYTFRHVTVANVNSIAQTANFDSNVQSGIAFESYALADKFDSITVEDSHFQYGTRFGVAINPETRVLNGASASNVVIRDNTCDQTGGSCFLVKWTDHALIQNNDIESSGSTGHGFQIGRGSGGWILGTTNVVIDHNVSQHSRGPHDTAGFHVDARNTNVLMQYNYFNDAQGHGVEILGNNANVILRYNVIIDSGYRTDDGGWVYTDAYDPTVGQANQLVSSGVYLYNNTLSYAVQTPSNNSSTEFRYGLKNSFMYNNVFDCTNGTTTWLHTLGTPVNNTVTHNLFNNAGAALVALDSAPVTGSPAFAGTDRSAADSFRLSSTSPARAAGVSRPDPGFDALGSGIFAGIPAVPNQDFYGHALPAGTPSIGADQS
ncbi:right-handed parallel beta-helix repeat-containing protein [Streptomyces sp. NPDC001288]|uniref:right-handed parallel beta-helix repeat-containing protein n=1 Tax=Streptomyces sp. NPDC001297 TaxID=3364559 RepID=UPI0036884508